MPGQDTRARRARVRSLWLKTDIEIAERLIDEGFAGKVPRGDTDKQKQLDSMRRNVWNDREALRKEWRAVKRLSVEDVHETRGEYLAILESLQDIGVEMLGDTKLKGTPKAQALQAVTRIVEAKGKAGGVAELEPQQADDDKPLPPIVGVIVGASAVSDETRKQLREQGVELDNDQEGSTPKVRSKRRRASADRPGSKA